MRLAVIIFSLLALLLPGTAMAQYVDRDDEARFESELNKDEFMMVARFRAITVPGFMLGLFFDEHANNWDDQANFAYGAEFSWRRDEDFEIGFALDYADLTMPSQFWLSSGDQPEDGDWTVVDAKLMSLVITSYWFWNPKPWLSPYVGGGIGAGLMLGDVLKYNPKPGSPCRQPGVLGPPSCYSQNGEPDLAADFDAPVKEDIPPVIPVINIVGGVRFNIKKHGVIKLELGFQDYAFAGIAAGGQW
jgi:opacity protein-like surface antigen